MTLKFGMLRHESILCLADQIQFTEQCEAAIRENSLQQFLSEVEGQLDAYTQANVQIGGQTGVLELKLKALILDTIHGIEVVQLLMKNNITSTEEWLWQKQLRYYVRGDGIAIMRMVDAEFEYTYEYQGKPPHS
ncbi:cytoplasmic dynein 2 heavy chain 1-like [Anneissia japonica]|uniref:cytoplasmic dynein 2 heavy chain 1-like n=1 Tax=Anneissia japonica TaxID=1529436 RepID=UPI001425987D|nr:cytoplasmic dynein 2 heavy chain 1-like [Anneissia japonica]